MKTSFKIPALSVGVYAIIFGLTGALHADAEEMAPLKIEIPDPYFGGTPLDYFGPNLEKPNYKKRPPFMAPAGTTNVALGKTVDSSVSKTRFGTFEMLVDGDKDYKKASRFGIDTGLQWVQVDLGAVHEIYAVLLWHFHEGERVYFDTSVRGATDAGMTENVSVIFNNDHDNSAGLGVGTDQEYIESYKGKLIDSKGVQARYVRFYTKGNTTDDLAHYVEVEIFGKPAN